MSRQLRAISRASEAQKVSKINKNKQRKSNVPTFVQLLRFIIEITLECSPLAWRSYLMSHSLFLLHAAGLQHCVQADGDLLSGTGYEISFDNPPRHCERIGQLHLDLAQST